MRKLLCVFSLLAVAAVASADVQIFFTSAPPWAGAGNVPPGPPADQFAPSAGHGTDYGVWDPDNTVWTPGDGYVVPNANFPTAFVPNTTIAPGGNAYVWIRFNIGATGPQAGAKLQGLDLIFQRTDGTAYTPADVAYYMQDNTNNNGGPGGSQFRWDGDIGVPPYSAFKKAHQVLVAVTAGGIVAATTNNNGNMYRYTSTGSAGTALLGIVKVDDLGVFNYSLGTQGINFNTGIAAPPVEFGTLTTPEPAAMLLLGLAGLLIRRR